MKLIKLKNKKNLELKFSSGFTLIEVMTAVTVLSIGLVGSLTVISSNLRNISFVENRIIAAGLANDGIERVRNIRDTNWLEEDTWDDHIKGSGNEEFVKIFCGDNEIHDISPKPDPHGSPPDTEEEFLDECVDNNDCGLYAYIKSSLKCYGDDFGNLHDGYSGAQYSGFYRLIHVSKIDSDSNKVSVTVRWNEGGQNKYLTVEEIFYNWK